MSLETESKKDREVIMIIGASNILVNQKQQEFSKKDKILFVGFEKYLPNDIKDILSKRQDVMDLDTVFENNIQEAKDIVASDYIDIESIFININPKHIKGVANLCGYIADVMSLIRDALESGIHTVLVCPETRQAIVALFDELEKEQGENFMVVKDVNMEYLPAIIDMMVRKQHTLV